MLKPNLRIANVIACLCADAAIRLERSANPGKEARPSALGCHHAPDCQMAVKSTTDFYLVKNEMGGLPAARLRSRFGRGSHGETGTSSRRQPSSRRAAPRLVFTEPYQATGGVTKVYQIRCRACAPAKKMELRLIFKLHPLESIKGLPEDVGTAHSEQQHQSGSH